MASVVGGEEDAASDVMEGGRCSAESRAGHVPGMFHPRKDYFSEYGGHSQRKREGRHRGKESSDSLWGLWGAGGLWNP